MSAPTYPKSTDADICLILEGTYPFLKGGVANWVYELIRVFPQYRFAVIFLGTKEEDYKEGLQYPLADNLVHLEVHYLFEDKNILEYEQQHIDERTIKKIEAMHERFNTYISERGHEISELFELMDDKEALNEKLFLRSKSSWEFLVKKYNERYADQSFFDYFWSIRNLHRPFWDLAKVVDKMPKIKIVHSASTGYAGFLGALIQKKFQIPYILTEHGIYSRERWIELMRNYFFEYIIKEQNQFSNKKGILAIWVHFFTILAKVAYDAADPIISLIEGYRAHQIKDGALPERTRIISYGIDFHRYEFLNKRTPNQDKPIVACICRVVPIKDVKTFIRACALIIHKNPKAEAWVVGSFQEDPDYVETCKALTRTLGVEGRVKFLGECNVMEIFPQIDVLLLTSISEGTPFAILESFAVGIPVVATDVGGCGELIYGKNPEDRMLGAAGRLANIADPEAIAKATFELLDSPEAWAQAQHAGYERVKKYYSMSRFIEDHCILYQEAMNQWQA